MSLGSHCRRETSKQIIRQYLELLIHHARYKKPGLGMDHVGFESRQGKFFFPPKRPDGLCCPTSVLCKRYRGISRGRIGRGLKMTIHLHPVSWLRTSGAISLLPLHAFISCPRLFMRSRTFALYPIPVT